MPLEGNILFKTIAMKTPLLCMLSSLLFTTRLWAQPGGGGGLYIGGLYSSQSDSICILTDPSLHIRTFLLKDDNIYKETFLYQDLLKKNEHHWYQGGFKLPPKRELGEEAYRESDQRMYIVYRKDTMIIDFIGVNGGNAMGLVDYMDSLAIQKGYFTCYVTRKEGNSYVRPDYEDNFMLFKNSLTTSNVPNLICRSRLVYNPNIDLAFLREENLPASFYYKRANWYLQKDQVELAFPDIQTGVKKNNDTIDQEAAGLFCAAYTKTKQYDKAIDIITTAIKNNGKVLEEKQKAQIDNYRTRIELYIQVKEYGKALADYNKVVALSSTDKEVPLMDRAYFMLDYLHDYMGVISEVRASINAIAPNHLSDRPQGHSEYCEEYFLLALAEYRAGEKAAAWKHWLKAEEFGYGQTSGDYAVIHFDSIIRMNATVPELYLARGLAHYKRGAYLGWGRETDSVFNNALQDINKAAALGMKDYRINMYRATVLKLLKKNRDALKEVNLAIAKNNNDPRCFLLRFEIRANLGQTKPGGVDADIKKYQELSNQWIWNDH